LTPMGSAPPAETTAETIVDWLDSVTMPGRCAGTTTNTRRPRSWQSETVGSKGAGPICGSRLRSRSAALTPATLKLPTLGGWSMPLRSCAERQRVALLGAAAHKLGFLGLEPELVLVGADRGLGIPLLRAAFQRSLLKPIEPKVIAIEMMRDHGFMDAKSPTGPGLWTRHSAIELVRVQPHEALADVSRVRVSCRG
jgi:hypothetical protein